MSRRRRLLPRNKVIRQTCKSKLRTNKLKRLLTHILVSKSESKALRENAALIYLSLLNTTYNIQFDTITLYMQKLVIERPKLFPTFFIFAFPFILSAKRVTNAYNLYTTLFSIKMKIYICLNKQIFTKINFISTHTKTKLTK